MASTLVEVIDQFESHVIDTDRSSNWKTFIARQASPKVIVETIKEYQNYENYMRTKDEANNNAPRTRVKLIEAYFTRMHSPIKSMSSSASEYEGNLGLKIATINTKFSHLKTYFKWGCLSCYKCFPVTASICVNHILLLLKRSLLSPVIPDRY